MQDGRLARGGRRWFQEKKGSSGLLLSSVCPDTGLRRIVGKVRMLVRGGDEDAEATEGFKTG